MLVRRESLALLGECYRFFHRPSNECAKLPKAVLDELSHVHNSLPLFRVSVAATWHSILHASDASSHGLGVFTSDISPVVAAQIGRVSES